jgi:PleD family two-component response regulator
MASPEKVMSDLLEEDASCFEELALIRQRVSRRLRRVCSEFSGEQFDAVVRDVSRTAFTDGLTGLEKDARLKFFKRHYYVKG